MNEEKDQVDSLEENKQAPKKIEVITGDGNLTISPVHEHLEVEKPKPKENRKIFIPEVKKDLNKQKEEDVQEESNDEE